MTLSLRKEAYAEAPSLERPLNEALVQVGQALDVLKGPGVRVLAGPFRLTGGTLPAFVAFKRKGSLLGVYLARIQPDDADEVMTTLGVLHWRATPDGRVELRALPGLTAAKTYQVWLEGVFDA